MKHQTVDLPKLGKDYTLQTTIRFPRLGKEFPLIYHVISYHMSSHTVYGIKTLPGRSPFNLITVVKDADLGKRLEKQLIGFARTCNHYRKTWDKLRRDNGE